MVVFFFKQKTAYEMRISDWSSDVCSSDLRRGRAPFAIAQLVQEALAQLRDDLVIGVAREQAVGIEIAPRRVERGNALDQAVAFVADGEHAGRRCQGFEQQGRTRTRRADDEHRAVERGVGIARSEEHTSELQSLMRISYAVFCLKQK